MSGVEDDRNLLCTRPPGGGDGRQGDHYLRDTSEMKILKAFEDEILGMSSNDVNLQSVGHEMSEHDKSAFVDCQDRYVINVTRCLDFPDDPVSQHTTILSRRSQALTTKGKKAPQPAYMSRPKAQLRSSTPRTTPLATRATRSRTHCHERPINKTANLLAPPRRHRLDQRPRQESAANLMTGNSSPGHVAIDCKVNIPGSVNSKARAWQDATWTPPR